MLKERDQLLAQNLQLAEKIENLKGKAEDNELMVLEKKEQTQTLQQKIAMLEQQKEQDEITQQELKQQLSEQQQAAKKPPPKGFWLRLIYILKMMSKD